MNAPISAPNLSRLGRDKRLALYGLAAGAALAAGASSAQANLITLDLSGLAVADRTNGSGTLYFDVNATSAAAAVSSNPFAGADFRLSNGSVRASNSVNGVQGFPEVFFKASRLTTSNFVGGAEARFSGAASLVPENPAWGPGVTGFIGLEFTIGTDVHFGWANITTSSSDFTITLNALGYESDPNTTAHVEGPSTGVPDQGSTLALLAIGAAGLLAFRKCQRRAA